MKLNQRFLPRSRRSFLMRAPLKARAINRTDDKYAHAYFMATRIIRISLTAFPLDTNKTFPTQIRSSMNNWEA